MNLRTTLLLVAFAACDKGAGDVSVDVELVSASCSLTDNGIAVDAEFDGALGVGEWLEVTGDIDGVLASTINQVWDCGEWAVHRDSLDQLDFGCTRESESQAERQVVSVQHTQTFDDPQDPSHLVLEAVVVIGTGGHTAARVELDCTR